MTDLQPSTATDGAAKPNRTSAKTWILGFAIVAALLLGGWVISRVESRPDPGAAERDATRVCEDFVKERLKAPATADFSDLDVTSDAGEYTVTGDVDAQNSFGAKLRSHFTCVVRDSGDQWTLVSVTGLS